MEKETPNTVYYRGMELKSNIPIELFKRIINNIHTKDETLYRDFTDWWSKNLDK